MGDSGEGLVDAEARIQERLEELEQSREPGPERSGANSSKDDASGPKPAA